VKLQHIALGVNTHYGDFLISISKFLMNDTSQDQWTSVIYKSKMQNEFLINYTSQEQWTSGRCFLMLA